MNERRQTASNDGCCWPSAFVKGRHGGVEPRQGEHLRISSGYQTGGLTLRPKTKVIRLQLEVMPAGEKGALPATCIAGRGGRSDVA